MEKMSKQIITSNWNSILLFEINTSKIYINFKSSVTFRLKIVNIV